MVGGGRCVVVPVLGATEAYSTPDEQRVTVAVGFTEKAWSAFVAWKDGLVRAYCEGRESLQVANGETPKPEGVCATP